MSTTGAPARTYRIAEVAERTGFTASALRFYEAAGVLPPPQRSTSGHRAYDDRDVERLRFIARAKDLGCTLEEISGLVEAWDADECAPVQHRLRSLVGEKVGQVRELVAEQQAFAAALEATAAALDTRPVDGPCDDTCGCASTTSPPRPVIACSLSGDAMASRLAAWRAALAPATERLDIAGGVRLGFRHGSPMDEVVRLAAAEHECCSFLAFAVTIDDRGIGLEITAPRDGRPLLDAVVGDAP